MDKEEQLELLKWETAKDLDLIHKVLENGWGELTAKETGKLGGIVSSKIKRFI